jgi:hypothetical protein
MALLEHEAASGAIPGPELVRLTERLLRAACWARSRLSKLQEEALRDVLAGEAVNEGNGGEPWRT